MNQATLLAATAAIALVVTPAFAAPNTPRPHSNVHMKSSKLHQHNVHHARAVRSNERLARHDELNSDWNRRNGFWPAAAAGAIAGGALATAGAIATAPFHGGYYDNGYYGGYDRTYGDTAYRNDYRYGASYASMDEGFGPYDRGFGTYNYNGTAIPGSPSFDARNGFTCRPGTITKLNGQPTLCQ
ncbi:putative protein OS=Afipia felis OX=1035 GN=BN961_00138 PE=4 SV=1 [Afipia felis]